MKEGTYYKIVPHCPSLVVVAAALVGLSFSAQPAVSHSHAECMSQTFAACYKQTNKSSMARRSCETWSKGQCSGHQHESGKSVGGTIASSQTDRSAGQSRNRLQVRASRVTVRGRGGTSYRVNVAPISRNQTRVEYYTPDGNRRFSYVLRPQNDCQAEVECGGNKVSCSVKGKGQCGSDKTSVTCISIKDDGSQDVSGGAC